MGELSAHNRAHPQGLFLIVIWQNEPIVVVESRAAEDVGWAVTRAARHVPFNAVCLPQAMAARIRSAAMYPFAAMHSQSGRLPTIATQSPRIEGVATFGVRVATLATTASWDRGKSITGGLSILVWFSSTLDTLDARTFSPYSRL